MKPSNGTLVLLLPLPLRRVSHSLSAPLLLPLITPLLIYMTTTYHLYLLQLVRRLQVVRSPSSYRLHHLLRVRLLQVAPYPYQTSATLGCSLPSSLELVLVLELALLSVCQAKKTNTSMLKTSHLTHLTHLNLTRSTPTPTPRTHLLLPLPHPPPVAYGMARTQNPTSHYLQLEQRHPEVSHPTSTYPNSFLDLPIVIVSTALASF